MGRHANIFLVIIVLSILSLMIFPMPTWAMDLFLTANIALSITLLLLSLQISEPLKFATFPTFLLLATLFRLGLNIATTRLILLQADAGQVIDAFGRFVVSGNVLVGAVVFLILTIVQFVVIAKGSERVAEVAARFTLDAMPGKQMSIDAELRAGHISHEQARDARNALSRESQLYGAMDGAMKFVKGDAIAGLIITLINILGGLGVGMLQMGMSASEAVDTYSILTVGDGLVSQIPALLVSVSAGFTITRVVSETRERALGQDMVLQLVQHAKVLFWVGVILILFGLVPGMPTGPFLLLGMGVLLLGKTGWISRQPEKESDSFLDPRDPDRNEPEMGPVPLLVECGPCTPTAGVDPLSGLKEELSGLAAELYWKTGVPVPPARIVLRKDLPENIVRVRIHELPAGEALLDPVRVLVHENHGPVQDPENRPVAWSLRDRCLWVEPRKIPPERERLTQEKVAAFLVRETVRLQVHEFMTMDMAQNLVRALRRTAPTLVDETVGHPVTLPLLTEVLVRLLEEHVSIRPLGKILASLGKNALVDPDPAVLAENVRLDLRREIVSELGNETGIVPVFLVSARFEEEIRLGIARTETGTWVNLDPEVVTELHERARHLAENMPPPGHLVLVSSVEIRRHLRKILAMSGLNAIILSYPELEGVSMIQPVGEF